MSDMVTNATGKLFVPKTTAFGGSGGEENHASGSFATVPGSLENSTEAHTGFAAGFNSYALNDGSFVWSDGTGTYTVSQIWKSSSRS